MKYTIATDGACLGNPGPGGWAFVVIDENSNDVFEDSGDSHGTTTNNRMEMMAAIRALEWFEFNKSSEEGCKCLIQSDSQYVIKGITEWINGWKKKGWRSSSKEPVKNEDLWRKIDELNNLINPEWEWVRGHNGHVLNERADKLANLRAGIES